MERKLIDANDIYPSGPAAAHAVRFGTTVYTSEISPKDASGRVTGGGDLRAQTEQAFRNLKAVLAAANARIEDVAKVNLYIDPGAFARRGETREVVSRFLRPETVAGTVVPIFLPTAGALVAVEAVAHIGVERKMIKSGPASPSESGWAQAVVAGSSIYVSARYGQGEPFLTQCKSVYDPFDALLKAANIPWRDIVRIHQFAIRPDLSVDDLRKSRAPYLKNTEFLSTSVVCGAPGGGASSWQVVADIEGTTAGKTYSSTPGIWANPGGLHAIKAGGTGYFTAQMSRDDKNKTLFADDVVAHADKVCANIDAMLSGAGLGWQNMVHARVFTRDMADVPAVRKVVDGWLKGNKCARTDLVVGFFDPLARVEIEVTTAAS
jgi:enamine deaminase RidA (YjgF/YER057c/UK114 family)